MTQGPESYHGNENNQFADGQADLTEQSLPANLDVSLNIDSSSTPMKVSIECAEDYSRATELKKMEQQVNSAIKEGRLFLTPNGMQSFTDMDPDTCRQIIVDKILVATGVIVLD